MTTEEKIICKSFLHDADNTHSCNEYKLLMELLEQEPTTKNDDTVSRKAVHDMLENLPITVEDKWFNWLQKACMRLAELPSVTPQESILDKIRAEIQKLRGCTCSCSDGIIDDVEDIIDKCEAESEDE